MEKLYYMLFTMYISVWVCFCGFVVTIHKLKKTTFYSQIQNRNIIQQNLDSQDVNLFQQCMLNYISQQQMVV